MAHKDKDQQQHSFSGSPYPAYPDLKEDPFLIPANMAENLLVRFSSDDSKIAESALALLVTADSGVNKQRLIAELADLGDLIEIVRLEASVWMTETEILDGIAGKLEIARGNDPEPLTHIVRQIRLAGSESRLILLVVDEADLLDRVLLDWLLGTARRIDLPVLLLADSAKSFDHLSSGALVHWDGPVIAEGELTDYLKKRFQAANMQLPEVFSEAVIKWIYLQSGGNTDLIDAAAGRVLHNSLPLIQQSISGKKRYYLVAITITTILIAIVASNQDYQPVVTSEDPASSRYTGVEVAAFSKDRQPLPYRNFEIRPVDDESLQSSATGLETPVRDSLATPARLAESKPKSGDGQSRQQKAQQKLAMPKIAGWKIAQLKNARADGVVLPARLTPEWLQDADDSLYTLQILGSHSKEQIERFQRQLGNPDQYSLFESQFEQRRWYVIVKGIYANRNDAVLAIKDLQPLTKQQPWARSLGSIKKEILESNSQ